MSKCVVVREDDPELAELVRDLLEEHGYSVMLVVDVEDLLKEAARRSPCVALVDGTAPSRYDLWWIGERLRALGVPPVAFTAHASARDEFAANPSGFVGLISKPFDAQEFLDLVDGICWEANANASSGRSA